MANFLMNWHLVLVRGDISPIPWYFTRAAAAAAYVALTASVIIGMLRPIARQVGERLSWVSDELHQFLALLTGLLVVGHLAALKLDAFIPFTFANLLIPGDQPYKPVAVNYGVFALYLMVLLLLTSWLRRFIAYRLWRWLHYASFVAFALVTAHGWLAGSDTNEPWMRGLYVGSATAVGFLVVMRLIGGLQGDRQAKEEI